MTDSTTCAIVGGGPAGMVLGLLLARAGVEVTVLEKHADFLRDFRGDTVHPSTLRLLDDLGLWSQFDRLPQSKVDHAAFTVDGTSLTMVDFRRLRQPHPYVAMVPQWDLLDLLADAGRAEPTFTLRMEHEVTGVLTRRRPDRRRALPLTDRRGRPSGRPDRGLRRPWVARFGSPPGWWRGSTRCRSTCCGSGYRMPTMRSTR